MTYSEWRKRFERSFVPVPESGCWLWDGAWFANGYGGLRFKGKVHYAHRIAYRLYRGRIKRGLHVCHKCDTPACVNPQHIFLGTRSDNMRDCAAKGRCCGERSSGAKLTEANVIFIRSSDMQWSELSKMFHVSWAAIYDVMKRRRWKHVA